MMDIYACAGKHDQVETLSKRVQLNVVQLNILIKSLGKAGKPDRATAILKSALVESRVKPNIINFNTLIDAWAESSRPDAVAQAFEVLRLLNEDPKCMKNRPKTEHGHLQLITEVPFKVKQQRCWQESSRNLGCNGAPLPSGGQPCETRRDFLYTLAIKTCLRAGDAERAEALMGRMEQSETPPNIRTYNDILNHWSQVGTPQQQNEPNRFLRI